MSLLVETSNVLTMTAQRNHVNSQNNIMTIILQSPSGGQWRQIASSSSSGFPCANAATIPRPVRNSLSVVEPSDMRTAGVEP
ncbi:hypothetical protein RHECNPAF_2330099 [Rhizobium etli CNPAF512]|nr:hypothetical protein RHECNPAF_2330099 [Rhizobium etli CNPAF512]